jgi:lipoprotein-anchoring transpeptidase ErfK/SrfK
MLRRAVFSLLAVGTFVSLPGGPAKAQYYSDDENRYVERRQGEIADEAPYEVEAFPYEGSGDPQSTRQRDRQTHRPAGHDAVVEIPPEANSVSSSPTKDGARVDRVPGTARRVEDPTGAAPGVITIDTRSRKLYLSLENNEAVEYRVGVGRPGFAWKGEAHIGRKAVWPIWTPPREMLLRRPELPDHMEGGVDNPLGARAFYLFDGDRDTLFRIHGTNEPDSIGKAVSSGCIRMINADIIDLYSKVGEGTRVVVR